MPLDEEGYFTVHAIAVAEDYKNSQEAIFIYAYPDAVQSPYANIPSGSVDLGTKVLLKNRTEGSIDPLYNKNGWYRTCRSNHLQLRI